MLSYYELYLLLILSLDPFSLSIEFAHAVQLSIRNHCCKLISSCQVQRYFYFSQILCSTNSVSSPTKFNNYSKECACEYDLPVFLQLYALLFEMGCAWCLHKNDLIFKESEEDLKNPYSRASL